MPTLNDARFVALRGQGFTGATNDMLLEWLQGQLPLANLLTNPELAGGAASGPVDGNNPPTGWTRPFNTADSAPIDIGGGFFEWEMNLAQDNGRCAISRDLADGLGGEVAGTKILFTVECSNPTPTNYSAALIASTFAGATVTGTVARVRPFSTETLALEFTIDDPATLRAEIRMGVGTTANNTVGLILRNPALYRSTDARTPRNSLPDAWSTFLALQLGSAATGRRNDDWYTYLGSLGHTGSLNDRELQFWLDGGVIGGGYTFNGADQYATHASWDTLGDSTVYPPQFAFITDNPDGNIVDPTPPITEFGRVGTSYHSGSLSNLRYTDTSPLNGKTALAGPAAVPEVLLENAEITFDIAYTAGEQILLTGNAAPNTPVDAPTGNQLVNSDFYGTRGTVPANPIEYRAPFEWLEGEWPPSQVYTNANANDSSIGFQPLYGADTGRGYIYQTIDTTGLIGERFNLSISMQVAIISTTNPPITAVGGCTPIRNDIPTEAGRYDSVFEVTGNSIEVRIGAGVLEDDQSDILVFRPQLTYGEELQDYQPTDDQGNPSLMAADTPILGTTSDGTLVVGANVDSVVVDGSPASAPLTGHQRVTVQVSEGTLTQIGEISAMANVVVNNYAY